MGTERTDEYGEHYADDYDRLYPAVADGMIDLLAELAGEGPALELGIGTGRVALPLAARGVRVCGIDSSERMVGKLRAKPGGADIDVTIGDFADLDTVDGGPFSLIYCPFNTLFALLTQDAQVSCLTTAAAQLAPGGAVLIEAFVPDPSYFDRGQTWRTLDVGDDEVAAEASIFDPVHQRVTSKHLLIAPQGVRILPIEVRFAWPAELDLMARIAGLTLRDRWANWQRHPFGRSSHGHISVYGATTPRG